jgi:hypothetical protein
VTLFIVRQDDDGKSHVWVPAIVIGA